MGAHLRIQVPGMRPQVRDPLPHGGRRLIGQLSRVRGETLAPLCLDFRRILPDREWRLHDPRRLRVRLLQPQQLSDLSLTHRPSQQVNIWSRIRSFRPGETGRRRAEDGKGLRYTARTSPGRPLVTAPAAMPVAGREGLTWYRSPRGRSDGRDRLAGTAVYRRNIRIWLHLA